MYLTITLLSTLVFVTSALGEYTWPSHTMDELEHLLIDTGGFNSGRVLDAITPCTNYVSGAQTLGRMTAAQWIRVSFHDALTHNKAAGTGGMDGSIGFETNRPENSGDAMNDTVGFFAPYVNAYTSMGDLIALAVVTSIGGCSSPSIRVPLLGGRIDATEGGEFGVPEPEQGIEEMLEQFEHAGFSQTDAIALTACGHTLGNVHHGGFPNVVPESAVSPNNTGGGIHFDSSVDVFDDNVVHEYLEWRGQRGGPLVTTENVTVRSDLRMYLSDGNATMKELSQSSEYFVKTCIRVISQMINSVPSTVTLSEEITPNKVKPINVSLSLEEDSSLTFSGYIRLLSVGDESSDVKISWIDRDGGSSSTYVTAATFTDTGSSLFGTTYYYKFSAPIDASTGISAFTVQVGKKTYLNGGDGYPFQDTAFYLPRQSEVGDDHVKIVAAVLTSAQVKAVSSVLAVPTRQIGNLSPKIVYTSLALEPSGTAGLYTFYTATADLDIINVEQTSTDIIVDGVVKDEFHRLTAVVV